jgi:hypothetical protein
MIGKIVCAAGAGVLLSASIVMAIPRGVTPGATGAAVTAPIAVASKHSTSSSSSGSSSGSSSARSSGSSGHASSSGGRSFGSARSGASAAPARGSQAAAPFRSFSAPRVTGGTAFFARPRGRYARHLIPLGALGTIYIGSRYYYPYRYLPYDGPVCSGVTENGCELRWMDVPTEDSGDSATQCVEFCPQD